MESKWNIHRLFYVYIIISGIPQPVAPKWYHRENYHYFFSDVTLKWTDAERDCDSKGAKLLKIENEEENAYLLRKMNGKRDVLKPTGQRSYWIGLYGFSCYSEPCVWEWSGGSLLKDEEFSNWATGYPLLTDAMSYFYIGNR